MKNFKLEVTFTAENKKELINEYGIEQFNKGYSIADSNFDDVLYNSITTWGFDHIERIDEIGLYDGDYSASLQAEQDGMELIFYNNIGYVKSNEVIEAIQQDLENKKNN